MLTNSQTDGDGLALSLVAKQRMDNGLDWLFGYAYTDQTDVSPMTSFTAGSNFDNLATTTLLDPSPATSNYVSPHRFTARLSYGREFLPGHETRITALFFRKKGQPSNFVMSSQPLEGDQRFGRHLLYIPTLNDSNVVLGPDFDTAAWAEFVRANGYAQFAGGFVPRNETHARWSSRMDLRIDQEIPFFFGTRARAYLKVYNLLNMLNDEWGVQYDAEFFSQEVVDMSLDPQNRYVYNSFDPDTINDLRENATLYEVRMGIQFEF